MSRPPVSPETWRERQAAGMEARKVRLRARPRDVERWRREGLIAPAVRPLIEYPSLSASTPSPGEVTALARV